MAENTPQPAGAPQPGDAPQAGGTPHESGTLFDRLLSNLLNNLLGIVVVLGGVVAALLIGGWLAEDQLGLPGLWGYIALVMILFLGFVGREMNQRWAGAFIDWRNMISLTRLQIVLWTVLVMSAYMAIALPRVLPDGLAPMTEKEINACIEEHDLEVHVAEDASAETIAEKRREVAQKHCPGDPLKIVFPEEVILAMGITITTFAGSGLIKDVQSKSRSLTSLKAEYDKQHAEYETTIADAEKAVKDAQKVVDSSVRNMDAASTGQQKLEGAVTAAKAKLATAQATNDSDRIAEAEVALKAAEDERDANTPLFTDATTQLTEVTKVLDDAKKALKKAQDDLTEFETNWQQKLARARGQLATNDEIDQATWGDMFRMEQAGDSQKVDLSKIQMFFFTIVVLVAYGIALYTLLDNETLVRARDGVDLPAVSASLNALLAISHGGYLAVKASSTDQTSSSGK
jgi:hypothetical protein